MIKASSTIGETSTTEPPTQVAAPTFSPAAGTYTSAQSVTMSSATSGASIYYTTNGTAPTSTTGTVYSTPVSVGATTTLKAIAYKTGVTDSTVATATYTINPTPPADITAPTTPTNLAGTAVSSTSVVLFWTQASDPSTGSGQASGVTGYDIYRDGTLLLTHPDNTYSDTTLAPGSAHTYRVAARDAAGNTSALSSAVSVTTDAAENPRLVRAEHLIYLGAFVFPDNPQNDYTYGGTSIGFNPGNNSLFARGHTNEQRVGEISIPPPVITTDYFALPVAAVRQNLTDITEGHRNEVGPDGSAMEDCEVGGLLVYGDRLLGTSYAYYDAGHNARRSHFTSGLDLAQTGDFSGMFTVGTRNPGFVAGYMAHIPPDWQAALGGPVLTGLDGVPIVTRTSWGPTVTVFDPSHLGSVEPVPGKLLVGYSSEHPTLGVYSTSEINPQFNRTTGARGLVFPFGSDSVLFFGNSGIGVPDYGVGTSDPALHLQPVPGTNGAVHYVYDPAKHDKGGHAYPYVAYIWAYRAADLARVAAGTAQPWEMVPYAMWALDLPFNLHGSNPLAGAAYDPATNRIFISQYKGGSGPPIILVYRVELPSPPLTYTTWRTANFSGTDLTNDTISGPLADPAGVGLTNLQRYAFALPARGPVANPVALGTADTPTGRVLTLTFPRRATASDLSYSVEASTDLVTWTPVPGRTYAPGAGPITAQDTVAIGTATRRFLRVRVTQP